MLLEKLQRLGGAAKWDSCGGTTQKSFRKAGIPAKYSSFIHDCSATSENCRLMKVLQGNNCQHDCKYCVNAGKKEKTKLEPKELAVAFNAFAKKKIVTGLFLSSAVTGNAEKASEKITETARLVRKNGFKGYVHLKVLPGTSKSSIMQLAEYADRLSLNIEVPSKAFLEEIGSTKSYSSDLEKRLKWINQAKEKRRIKSFTTQLIVGASSENDFDIIKKMNYLYSKTMLYRTYFSAFSPGKGIKLEKKAEFPLREHRLYQCDFLLREYGFELKEMKKALNENSMLSKNTDPKTIIAVNSPNNFPLNPNNSKKKELLKVPGIGLKTAENIIKARKTKKLTEFRQLKKLGVISKRAMPFLQLEKERQAKLKEF